VSVQTDDPVSSQEFFSGAYERIVRGMLVLAAIATLALFVRFGSAIAVGFLLGSAIAILNFQWLKRVVSALADRATTTGRQPSGKGVVARFLLRYFLIALGAYAIFKISPYSLYGLFAGLFLPVGGILIEAGYELYAALRRGV
jgi:hypothetical protein